MSAADAHRSIETVWRMESTRLIAGLVGVVRDVELAEDLAQEALVAALRQWPESGIPNNPRAWLMTVAKRRAVDEFRRLERADRRQGVLADDPRFAEGFVPDFDGAIDEHIDDDVLRLMFICCHPVLAVDAQVALTLRLVGGLTTGEIARAFLTNEPVVAQRIVRAKRTLRRARVAFEEPDDAALAERLDAVLEVVYLVFNEGYAATAGDSWMRPALCEEALRLGRVLAGVAPNEPEVHGLVALMEIQASRAAARMGPDGEPVLLLDQNRGHWDQLLIRRGLAALERAETLSHPRGPYTLQAAIAACHASARVADDTDWARIAMLYDELSRIAPSPVVEVNRAVAVGMAYGPATGLALADQLLAAPSLANYHLLPTVRGDLLARLGRNAEASSEFERAASLTNNARERALLLDRATRCRTAH